MPLLHILASQGIMPTLRPNTYQFMQDLSDQALTQVAQYFSALAEPTRLRLLNSLREGEKNVGDLATICGCSQANVSRHLSMLAKHGLIQREARGNTAFYSIADPSVYALCDLVCGNVSRQLLAQAQLLGVRNGE
jgi:DNA-binding transcriptional ArsR family regulator